MVFLLTQLTAKLETYLVLWIYDISVLWVSEYGNTEELMLLEESLCYEQFL